METMVAQTTLAHRASRLVVPLTLCAVLTTLDLASKVWLVTPEWGWHRKDSLAAWFFVAVPLAFLVWRVTMWAGAVFLAGWLGNIALTGSHGTANPLSFNTGSTTVVFNFADVYLWAGVLVLCTCIAAWLAERAPVDR